MYGTGVGGGLELALARQEPAVPPPEPERPELGRHAPCGLLGPPAHPVLGERQRSAREIERAESRQRQRLQKLETRHAPKPADGLPRALQVEAVEGVPAAVAGEDDRAARDPHAPSLHRPAERGEATMPAARES